MSMTQVAFLKKVDLPSKLEIESNIRKYGYEFKILNNFEKFDEVDGLECIINGTKTFFEVYFDQPYEITNQHDWIKGNLTNEDIAVSFIWGADFGAGACIGLISIALIDISNALIYYLNDKMSYSRKMLVDDTPLFIAELNKR